MTFAFTAMLLGLGAGAAMLLRRGSANRDGAAWSRGGWLVVVGGLVAAALALGWAFGIAVAAVCVPIGALLVVAQGATRRAPREARIASRPFDTLPRNWPRCAWRGWLKAALAGPIGLLAALGLSSCYAVWAPGTIQTRLLVAGLLMPTLWGVAMIWALSDERIARSSAVLIGTAAVSFGLALARGIA